MFPPRNTAIIWKYKFRDWGWLGRWNACCASVRTRVRSPCKKVCTQLQSNHWGGKSRRTQGLRDQSIQPTETLHPVSPCWKISWTERQSLNTSLCRWPSPAGPLTLLPPAVYLRGLYWFIKKIGFLFLVFLFTHLCVGMYMLACMYLVWAHSCMCLQRPWGASDLLELEDKIKI